MNTFDSEAAVVLAKLREDAAAAAQLLDARFAVLMAEIKNAVAVSKALMKEGFSLDNIADAATRFGKSQHGFSGRVAAGRRAWNNDED